MTSRRALLLKNQNLTLPQRDKIAAVAAIRPVHEFGPNREAGVAQIAQIDPEEDGAEHTVEAEGWQELRRVTKDCHGATLHSGAGADAAFAEQHERARDHRHA